MKVRIESGEDKVAVIRDVVSQCQWPLLGATAIAVIAFAAIGLSEDKTGEYCNSLFWVIFISLAISWVAAITFTPLLGYLLFKPNVEAAKRDPYAGRFSSPTGASWCLHSASGGRCWLFRLECSWPRSIGFRHVTQSFFRPRLGRSSWWMSICLRAPFRESEAFADTVQRFIQTQPGVTHVSSFIGGGGSAFCWSIPGKGEPSLRGVPGQCG